MALIDGLADYVVAQLPEFPLNILGEQPLGDGDTTGLSLGIDFFKYRLPAEANDAVVVITPYQGRGPDFTMGVNTGGLEYPRFQVYVRGDKEDAPGAWALSKAIYYVLDITTEMEIGGVQLLRCNPLGDPMPHDFDSADRPIFTTNFECCILPYQ